MIHHGDCLEILKTLENDSVDSLVTDPPAGISFMNKSWDDDKGGRDEWISWLTQVMRETLRVLKPGAHGLVWSLPRTSHWTATALENAGFEVRDCVTHLFGSGFPKSLNVGLAIDKLNGEPNRGRKVLKTDGQMNEMPDRDYSVKGVTYETKNEAAKQWQGWGTALKPAAEFWWLVRKPLSEKTVAKNVLKWGVGGLNIDGSRIEAKDQKDLENNWLKGDATAGFGKSDVCYNSGLLTKENMASYAPTGRFPANLVFSHSPYCTEDQCDIECAIKMLDEQSGTLKSGSIQPHHVRTTSKTKNNYSERAALPESTIANSGGGSRFFYCAKVSSSERNAGLDGMPTKAVHRYGKGLGEGLDPNAPALDKNSHPTVKALKLMSYLINLITPPNGTVLDPFMGSGSTGLAARKLDFEFIGIEKEEEYFHIASKRIESNLETNR